MKRFWVENIDEIIHLYVLTSHLKLMQCLLYD